MLAGANAASVSAARSARCRAVNSAGAARTCVNSAPFASAATHRRSVIQPVTAASPTTRHGLVCCRTSRWLCCICP
jgi:hypothetical protein